MSFDDQYLNDLELYCRANDELPSKAICQGVINREWLKNASPEDQLTAICQWFVARYIDPENVLPYDSEEKGYIWIDGGPYDAGAAIKDNFTGQVPDAVLEQAISIINDTGISDWSLIGEFEDRDLYIDDADCGLYIDDADESLDETRKNISKLIDLLGQNNQILNRLLFAAMISVLETYLWRTMSYVSSRPGMSGKILSYFDRNNPRKNSDLDKEIKAEKQERSDHNHEKKRVQAEELLATFYWQDIGKVEHIFKEVLGIVVNLSCFKSERLRRHDIVHRFGKDKTGELVHITENDVRVLSKNVLCFCVGIHNEVNCVLQNDSNYVNWE